MRRLLSGGLLILFGMVFQFFGSFIGKIILGRGLGDAAYGTFMVLLTTTNLVAAILRFGLPAAIAQKVPRSEGASEKRSVLISAYQVSLILTISVGLIFLVAAPLITSMLGVPNSTLPLQILALGLPAVIFVSLSTGAIRATERALPHVIIKKIVQPLTLLGLYTVVVLTGLGVVGAVLAYVGAAVAAGGIAAYFLYRDTSFFDRSISTQTQYWSLIRFSAPLVISTIAYSIYASIDTLLISALTTVAATGHYRAAYPIAMLLTAPLSAFSYLLMPQLSRLDSKDSIKEMRDTYTRISSWIFFITFPAVILLVLYPEIIIQMTFGEQYTPGSTVLPILAVALGSHVIIGPNKDALTSIGKTDFIMIIMLTTAVANTLLNLAFIPRWGILGAAVATAISYLLLNSVLCFRLYQNRGITPLSRRTLGVGFGSLLLALTIFIGVKIILFDPVVSVGTFTALFGLLYAITVIRYGLINEDVNVLQNIFEQFSIDLSIIISLINVLRKPIWN